MPRLRSRVRAPSPAPILKEETMYKEALLEELNSELKEGLNNFLGEKLSEAAKSNIKSYITEIIYAFFCRNNIGRPVPLVVVEGFEEHCYACGQNHNPSPNSLSISLLDPITKEPYVWDSLC